MKHSRKEKTPLLKSKYFTGFCGRSQGIHGMLSRKALLVVTVSDKVSKWPLHLTHTQLLLSTGDTSRLLFTGTLFQSLFWISWSKWMNCLQQTCLLAIWVYTLSKTLYILYKWLSKSFLMSTLCSIFYLTFNHLLYLSQCM